MTYRPNTPTSLEVKREERERREARDRILAREVGIEIGRRRERERLHREKDKAFGRGFMIGIIVAVVFMFVGWYGAAKVEAREGRGLSTIADNHGKSAKADTIRKVRIGSGTASSWAVYRIGERTMPPGWRTFLRICQLEQPGPGWRGVWWKNTVNYSFPGGCGLTRQNYTDVKHPAWPDTADALQPRDQLWASFWLFWKYARIGQEMRGSYEGGQRYGSTVWDVHTQMGFDGFHADGKTPN
jgi:hypothetical protein